MLVIAWALLSLDLSLSRVGYAQAQGIQSDPMPPSKEYKGASYCAGCHQDIYASWQKTAHAITFTSSDNSPRCLTCHVTALESSADRSVGCEACHGPGGAYAFDDIMRNKELATLLGLRELSVETMEPLCMSCHNLPTKLSPFNVKEAWGSIAHPKAALP